MGGRNTVVSIKDPLTVSVSNTMDVEADIDTEGNILAIDIPGLSKIAVGDKLTISSRKVPYKINKIVSRDIMGLPVYDLMVAPRTRASLFILPMLPGNRNTYYYDKFLLNCFVGTKDADNVIAILFRFSGLKTFAALEESMKKLKSYMQTEDPTKSTVLYLFSIPKRYKEDFNKFLKGKYSEMSENYKYKILSFHGVSEESSIGQILFKDPSRKIELEELLDLNLPENAELYSIPNMDQEIYDPDQYDL
tara:strand:+ start:2785 stop:3531 length:747 start_codon:yes stop_codon:yes gene_type:complete